MHESLIDSTESLQEMIDEYEENQIIKEKLEGEIY